MSLEHNMQIAQSAIDHVASLDIISANKIGHRIRAAGGIDNVIGSDQGVRMQEAGPAGDGLGPVRHFPPGFHFDTATQGQVRIQAGRCVYSRFGNCQELAMVAAIHMIDAQGAPIHLMRFNAAGYDHVWTTIGVDDDNWAPNDMRSWGHDAVWVDPWQTDTGIAFSIRDFIAGRVRNLNAIYMCNSVERVQAGNVLGNNIS
ncbi:MAG: hypothetical protein AAGB12_13235 [Pseudomonadota bacterium]